MTETTEAKETKLVRVRPWPCDADCDAPTCREKCAYALSFDCAPTPGLDTLYLCYKHMRETADNYGWKA